MGVVITEESELGIELRKWNRPYRYEHYPRMLYRAQRTQSGKWKAMEDQPHPYQFANLDPMAFQRAEEMVLAFNRGCQLVVNNEEEERRAKNEGWRESIKDAEDYHRKLEEDIAQAAAHRHYEDRNLSDAAKAEAKAADDAAGARHLPEVPRKPGRPRKADADAA